jgi:hypothetical protein
MQSFHPWHVIANTPEYLTGVFVLQPPSSELAIICDGDFKDDRLLVLRFEQFEAVMIHEEFAHQWHGESKPPALPKSPDSAWTFPFLRVQGSVWAANSVRSQYFQEIPAHFSVISSDMVIDVLSFEEPTVAWTTREELESVSSVVAQLGRA